MAGKPFNPFEDDDGMEFVPGSGAQDDAAPVNPIANHATQVKRQPTERPKKASNLKLDFADLQEVGTDTRGATKIGADKLGSEEFLNGIKRKDFETSVERAKAAQSAPARAPVQEGKVVRRVHTPLYLLALGMVLFVLTLVGGFYGYKAYLDQQEQERIRALDALKGH